ncbi:hypothetical protein PV11_06458 [Exophiala sideris]|uniref:Heterokaryon incompatibility domain-containing protein n=1 Tax=Exophiala sideris TaxID=1016849 RepID=A0A0D1YDG2_9EURO|nr:hypothetical protein PV11_06458 [Exophiala sideris]
MNAFSAAELRLLIETEDEVRAEAPVFKLDGRTWLLRTFTNPTSVPGYICVSYVWGTGRVPNPFLSAPASISANTVPALSAAMAGTECKAFWIDAFCIPTQQPARRATLESMGYIYSQAVEVRAVLSARTFTAVQQLSTGDRLDETSLAILDADKWVQSVWTYQEVVNSRDLAFVCANAVEVVVDGTDFLNGLGFTLHKYKQKHGLDTFAIREMFPSLDALDDVLGDWRVASRCALLVMSNMDRRKWTEERNYFYAMIGSVTSKPCHRTGQGMEDQHLSETFMSVCEEKNDFSFIYTSAERSTDPSRHWRPGAGLLPSLLPWQSWGKAQPGHFDQDDKFWLDEVLHFELSVSSLTEAARDFIARWLHRGDLVEKTEEEIAQAVHSTLLRMGFTGSRDYIILGDGLFYPQTLLVRGGFDLVVSTTIRWPLGAPGLVRVRSPRIQYIPGVFVGPMGPTGPVTNRSGTSFCLE